MKTLLLLTLALGAGITQAQELVLDAPLPLERLQGAGVSSRASTDPTEMPIMQAHSIEGSLKQWYVQQKQPAIVVYFDKKLDKLPPGWRGANRLLIEENKQADGKSESRQLTIGVQSNTEVSVSDRTQFAGMFEQSLQQELKSQNFHLLDGVVLHRKLAAGNKGEAIDMEYESLQQSARFVFEVELICLNGECNLFGVLKNIHNGEINASVRLRIDGKLDTAGGMDHANRDLVRLLLRQRMS